MAEQQDYRLPRTGDVPVVFRGEQVLAVSGQWHGSQEAHRWHEIAVYRTAGGKYVLAVTYRTAWQGEDDHYIVTVYDEKRGVAEALRDHDPLEHLLGYPPHPTYAEKQARLEESLRQRWQTLVTRALDALGVAERVE